MGHPVQPPAQAGSPRAGCTAPHPGGAGISPEKETPQPLWAAWVRAPSPSEGRSSSSRSDGTSSASVTSSYCSDYQLKCRESRLRGLQSIVQQLRGRTLAQSGVAGHRRAAGRGLGGSSLANTNRFPSPQQAGIPSNPTARPAGSLADAASVGARGQARTLLLHPPPRCGPNLFGAELISGALSFLHAKTLVSHCSYQWNRAERDFNSFIFRCPTPVRQ